ncbi:MAG: hypothetical protein ACRCX8_06615 [Sarcina sp.]
MDAKEYLLNRKSEFWNKSELKNEEVDSVIDNKFFIMKVEFLNSLENISIETLDRYIRMFISHFLDVEKTYNKDLYDFNIDEIKLTFKTLSTTSMSFKGTLFYLVRSYLEWAYEEGYRNTVNDIKLLEDENLLDVDVKRLEKKYISLNKTLMICKKGLLNSDTVIRGYNRLDYADALILLLVRSGFTLEEAMNIEFEDIDIDNCEVNYCDEDKKYSKYIKLDNRIIEYVKDAIIETGGQGRIIKEIEEPTERQRIVKLIKASGINAPTRMKNYTDSQMVDDLDNILDTNGEVRVIDVQGVKKHYEPLSVNSSYTTLKNFYSKIRSVEIQRDKPGRKTTKTIDKRREMVKNILASIE